MNSIMIRKIPVSHVVSGVHTEECESIPNWDTVWNTDLRRNMDGDIGLWQCEYCECVRDRDSADMISYEEYQERYL